LIQSRPIKPVSENHGAALADGVGRGDQQLRHPFPPSAGEPLGLGLILHLKLSVDAAVAVLEPR